MRGTHYLVPAVSVAINLSFPTHNEEENVIRSYLFPEFIQFDFIIIIQLILIVFKAL